MLSSLQATLLGILQGLTEFLPVSSSGHLVLVQNLFNWHPDESQIVAFDLTLHLGTLVAVLVYFWRDIRDIIVQKNFKLMWWLAISTLPAIVAVLLFKERIEMLFDTIIAVGIGWIVTGIVLWCSGYVRKGASVSVGSLRALIIGIAQAIAIMPGVSRSGSTMVAGMYLGLEPMVAARYSFLMSVIVIALASLSHVKEITAFSQVSLMPLILGFISSAIVGYLTIKWLLGVIGRGQFKWFGVYCVAIGIVTLIFFSK